MSRKKISTTIYLRHDQWEAVRKVAMDTDISYAEIIREGVDLALRARKRTTVDITRARGAAKTSLTVRGASPVVTELAQHALAACERVAELEEEVDTQAREVSRLRRAINDLHETISGILR